MSRYVCEFDNLFGINTSGFRRPTVDNYIYFDGSETFYWYIPNYSSSSFWLGSRSTFHRSIETITGHSNVDLVQIADLNYTDPSPGYVRAWVYGDADAVTGVRPAERLKYTHDSQNDANAVFYDFQPTGYTIGNPNSPTGVRLSMRYSHRIHGFTLYADIVITGTTDQPWMPTTITEIFQAFTNAGLNFSNTSYLNYNNQPVMRCVNIDLNTATTINITRVLTSTPIRLSVVDGDPPFIANVSTTEPTGRAIGDLWFNPNNGNLSVYTGE